MADTIVHPNETLSLNKKYKVHINQQKAIERLIESETKVLREKLYEAFSRPATGSRRAISVVSEVIVEES